MERFVPASSPERDQKRVLNMSEAKVLSFGTDFNPLSYISKMHNTSSFGLPDFTDFQTKNSPPCKSHILLLILTNQKYEHTKAFSFFPRPHFNE